MRELCRQRFYVIDMASISNARFLHCSTRFSPSTKSSSPIPLALRPWNFCPSTPRQKRCFPSAPKNLPSFLRTASRGRLGLAKAEEIQEAAKNSFGIVLASGSFALIIRQYIEQIRSLESSIAVFDTEIARLLAGFDTQLTTITGIGPTLAAVILSEIGGDIKTLLFSRKAGCLRGR